MISSFIMRAFSHFVATGAYSGLSPISPGTVGSLASILVWLCLGSDFWVRLVALISLSVLAIITVQGILKDSPDKDPQFIVIDEWLGMWVALLPLTVNESSTTLQVLIAFVLFRLFDILKPWPVSLCESYPGAYGVLLDDVAAGAIAAMIYIIL